MKEQLKDCKHEHSLLLTCTTCDATWSDSMRATSALREYMASKPALRHNVEEQPKDWEQTFDKLMEQILDYKTDTGQWLEIDLADTYDHTETVNKLKGLISSLLQSQRQEIIGEIKKIVLESVAETEKEHGSPNVYIDMVGELFVTKLESLEGK